MAVKLIASDLDGTLLRNDKSISEETGKALEKAEKQGYILFRPPGVPWRLFPWK